MNIETLKELKQQETKLYTKIKRMSKRKANAEKISSLLEQRETIIVRMIPLRDMMLSELQKYDDWLMLASVRYYFSGMTYAEIAEMYDFISYHPISEKVKKAERLLNDHEQ